MKIELEFDMIDPEQLIDFVSLSVINVADKCADIAADQHSGLDAAKCIREATVEIVKSCMTNAARSLGIQT